MRIGYFVLPIALLAASCKTVTDGDLGAGVPLNSDKTLWSVTDVPQVGSIVRLHFDDSAGKHVTSSSLYSTALSSKTSPQIVSVGDFDQTLTANNGLKLAISFIAKGAPNASADLSNAKTLKLTLKDVKVAQPVDFVSFQDFIRSFDGNNASGSTIHNIFAQINESGNAQRKSGVMTPYWVVTKVFTASNLQYSSSKKSGFSGKAGCGTDTNPCIVPTSSLTASLDLTKDTQSIFKGTDRPIFVVIKPIGVNSQGSLYIEEGVTSPAVLAN